LEWLREILQDIDSLIPHTSFFFEKINFLMDATLSFVNIEQNKIIKIFSVAAAVFLPPTLVASVYGMNFEFMPELKWVFGYPWAIGLMILSALLPLLYFRRQRWL
jgi:magnesium transporter